MTPAPSLFARIVTTLRLRTQLVLVVALAGGIPLALSAVVAQRASADALTRAAMARVEAMRAGRVVQIEQAFATVASQAVTLAEDTMLVEGSVALIEAFKHIDHNATPAQLEEARAVMSVFYEREFGQRLRERTGTTGAIDLATHVQQHAAGQLAQARFIGNNKHPLGEKHKLDTAGDDAYANVHARLHPLLRSYLERFGYYDIFVIDPATNIVVYTVFKETDFAKRLDPATAPTDGLVRAVMHAKGAPEHTSHFEDFAPYEPSYNDAAAFVSAPIYKDGVLIAVLAMQLPVDRINGIVNEATGLGTSGHAFLVGADGRMRTQDRLTDERTIFVRRVDTSAVRAAATGDVGAGRYLGGADEHVLGAWAPVHIDGLQWSLVVELDEREALTAVSALSRSLWQLLAASLLALATIGVLFSSRLARRIGGAVHAAEAVAQGDFSTPIVIDGKDEVGVLLGALQQMRTALVKQMTAIEAQATSLQVLLDSTGDAMLPVGRDGGVKAGVSTITKAWFGDVEPGAKVWDYLFGTHGNEAMAFELAFSQMSDDVFVDSQDVGTP
jgi:methyl-accepting chemotaxis protein